MTVDLVRACGSAAEARRLADAVRADNPRYVTVGADGPSLSIAVRAPTPTSARETLEDLLACLQAAERTSAAATRSAK